MKYTIDTTTDLINSTGGIALIGKIAEKIHLTDSETVGTKITDDEIIACMYGLISQGRFGFEEISSFCDDPIFKDSLNIQNIPSPITLRLYLEKLADNLAFWQEKLNKHNSNLLTKTQITPLEINNRKYVPIDIDVSPFDNSNSKKEGVSWTYKKHDGYAPIFTYIGKEGYMLDCELRKGSQHCQKDTPEYLKRNLEKLKKLTIKDKILFRLDSGNDAPDTIKVISDSGHFFLIKRNPRKENREKWLDTAKSQLVTF